MSDREQILQQALNLPPEDRAYVAVALENSLEPIGQTQRQSDAELLAELQRRSAAYQSGHGAARDATDVLADLTRRQAGEPTT